MVLKFKNTRIPVQVKICCISSIEEARIAVRYGASAIGLVSEMPSGPGVIPENRIAEITEAVSSEIDTFLLTSKQRVDEIVEQHRRCRTTTIQLVDELAEGSLAQLKKALPDVRIVQVIHVTGKPAFEKAVLASQHADALLLDSGNPQLETKELGGTGRTHNWDLSQKIVRSVQKPVFLAGGLNPDNIVEAIDTVNPFGVDICSGLRTEGALSEQKVSAFFRKIDNSHSQ